MITGNSCKTLEFENKIGWNANKLQSDKLFLTKQNVSDHLIQFIIDVLS